MVRTRPQSPLTRMVLFTDIISHITTTDSDGKPTTILTTYPSLKMVALFQMPGPPHTQKMVLRLSKLYTRLHTLHQMVMS
ncbi:Hypothetical protein J6888_03063 [Nakaseomyces glabratus]